MMDQFHVRLRRVTSVGRAFSSQQDVPSTLASQLDGAPTVVTGDPSLDATIRERLGEFTSMLERLGQALQQSADGLQTNAQNYQSTDQNVAAGMDGIQMPGSIADLVAGPGGIPSVLDSSPPPPPKPPSNENTPMSSLDIAAMLKG